MRRFTDARALLNDLLDRYEARPESQRVQAQVYYDGFTTVAEEDACIGLLEAAGRAGAIELAKRRRDGVARVAHVRLADASALYRHLGRIPDAHRAREALADLRRGYTLPPSAGPLFEEIKRTWARGHS